MKKAIVWGVSASLGLLGFYFILTTLLSGSLKYSALQFWQLRLLMMPLVLGFGIQVGLWQYLKIKQQNVNGAGVASGAGVGGIAMVVCCAHHVTELLPILGLSAFSILLIKYQPVLLTIAILSNLAGIIYMAKKLHSS